MSNIQTRPSRLASQQSSEKTQVIMIQDAETVAEECIDVEKIVPKKKKQGDKIKSTNIIPIVTQNSKKYDLNYFKQFSKRVEHCERDLFRIHDPVKNKKDHGSKDHGLVYIEFNAGLFQAMKSNMMKIAKDYNINIISDPKIEFYGNAEERMLLDLKIIVKGVEHFIKMKVYNTTCAMDFQALKHDIDKKFEHLEGLTVAEYFTQKIVVQIANTLCNKIDIQKLNNCIRKLALDGQHAVKNIKKCSKFGCSKDISKGAAINCIYCESLTHKSCMDNTILDTSTYRCETCLVNDVTTIQSGDLLENENILQLSLLYDSSEPCTLCAEIFETGTQLQNHISVKHILQKDKFQCSVCNDSFQDEDELKMHNDSKHEVRKRLRGDTSLLEGRCDCREVNRENEELKNEVKAEKESREVVKLELEAAKNDIIKKTERIQNLEEMAKIELENKKEEVNKLKEKIKNIEEALALKEVETDNLKKENESLRKIPEPNQELQRLRVIIQDREKAFKKAEEEHKKEIVEQERAKKNAEENLNSAIQENTKIKEKESTMYEILEGLRKLLNLKDNNSEKESDVQVVEKDTTGGAIPKQNSFICEKCKFSCTNMSFLNKHIRQEHISTLFPCIICDLQARSIEDLRDHEKNIHNKENNDKCSLCNFKSANTDSLNDHMKTHSNPSNIKCNYCTTYFTQPETLEAHKVNKHNIDVYPCNDCGVKAKSLSELDDHIRQVHTYSKRDKNIDMRDLSDRTPCDPQHPNHTSDCCDRRTNSKEARRSRGQCKYWSQGRCYRGETCKFAHVELCRFQDKCLYYESCGYLHYSEQNQNNFLEPRTQNHFIFRAEDFPPLKNTLNRNRSQ